MKSSLRFSALAAFLLAMSSCTGIYAGLTGTQVPGEPVTTKAGDTFNVASQDIVRTKTAPKETVWGLYDTGAVARATAQVVDSGK